MLRITCGAPFEMSLMVPSGNNTVLSVFLSTGLKGMNLVTLYFSSCERSVAAVMALSIGSWLVSLLAREAITNTYSPVKPSPQVISSLSSVSLLRVSVPVLSLHSTSMPAISSMADSRVTTADSFESSRAPTDNTVVVTTGMAMGTTAVRITKHSLTVWATKSPRFSRSLRAILTINMMTQKKRPMRAIVLATLPKVFFR
mmetsp:Transcript_16486/g.39579  ORF Transcript_16486/g.39579 Transcript_16486/m.39579 type:complete len:200 (-) Transcript_16486:954-1553(-)